MTLQVIDGGGDDGDGPRDKGRRILAPGAPPSDGPIPNALAAHLQRGEVLAWWGSKTSIQIGPIGLTLGAALVALAMVSAFAPELWAGGIAAMWAPLLALASPTLFVLAREWMGRGSILVTHNAVIEVDIDGHAHRIGFGAIKRVRRDWLRGGVRLEGARVLVRIPPMLMDDTRAAIESRVQGQVRGGAPDDPAGWLP